MNAIELKFLNAGGQCALFGAADGSPFYYLMLDVADAPRDPISAVTAWQFAGAYVWAQSPVSTQASGLATELGLSPGPTAANALAWLPAPGGTPVVMAVLANSPTSGRTMQTSTLPFGNLGLQLPAQTSLLITADGVSIGNSGSVSLVRGSGGTGGLSPTGDLSLGFGGPNPGAICGSASWDSYDLFQLAGDDPYDSGPARAGELRYFRPGADGMVVQYAYPTMPAVPNDGTEPVLELDLELHPGAPYDGERTRLRFGIGSDVSGLASSYLATTAGAAVALSPLSRSEAERAGFYFGRRGPTTAGEGTGPLVYLAPLGSFAVTVADPADRILCGLNGLEFFTATTGDRIELRPSRPALAVGTDNGQPSLEPACTTSWVELGEVSGSYFGQPGASVNFGAGAIPKQASGAMTLPAAVASRVRPLVGATAVPLVFYGGLDPAGGPSGDQRKSLEDGVLAPTRGALLRTATSSVRRDDAVGDRDDPPAPTDPVFADASGQPLAGGRTSTPQGFVVTLNDASSGPAGTWAQLQLARSGAQYLAFDATGATEPGQGGVISSWLATTVLQDQLFLVLNDWQRFPLVQRLLTVAGFNFELGPDADAAEPAETVLIMKFNTAYSLADLIDGDGWAHPEVFVGDPVAVAATRQRLQQAIQIAFQNKGKPDDPFGYFRDQVAGRAGWTGVLSFNAPINGNGMPADLQMLFAGIDGQLRAHHFGVELNRVSRDDPAGPTIEESSLFGVIHYEEPAPAVTGDYGFAVEELNVAIAQTTVTELQAKVALTVNTLFGRSVSLLPASNPPNTLRLTGRYQKHGDVGTLTFDQPEQAAFAFTAPGQAVRVLDRLQLSNATLTPVASAATPTGTASTSTIQSRFSLGGMLSFRADPFPGVQGLDLFSYGYQDQGIGMSGVALTISCELDADGSRIGPPTIVADLSATTLSDNASARRPGSLVDLLPVTLEGFLQNPADGLSAGALGATPLNVVELAPASNPGPDQTTQQSRQTNAPQYALRFRLPLGTLGTLSDVHASLDAWLVLGWGPSSYTPDNDGAGIFVQLPALSAGALGFNLEGLLKTTFGDANLMRVPRASGDAVYVVLFNNVALSLLGLKFPPRVITDLILFAGGAGAQSLGWSLAATQLSSESEHRSQYRALA